jgi:hypothetical protein
MLFSIFLLFCLLVTYPLALVAPGGLGGTSLRFIVTVPTLFAVSLAALLGTLLTPRANCEVRILRAGQGLLLVILAWGVVTSVLNPGSSSEALFLRVGLFSIPLFVALADRPDPGTVVSVLAIAWGFNTLYAVLDIAGSQQAVGLAGNRNWMASATIALLPWAWLAIRHLLEPAVPCGKTRRASTAEDCRLQNHSSAGVAPGFLASGPSIKRISRLPRPAPCRMYFSGTVSSTCLSVSEYNATTTDSGLSR